MRADRAGDRVVGAVAVDQDAQPFQGEPGDLPAGFDRELAERFEEEGLAGARGAADDQVLAAADPLQGPQRRLGRGRDRRAGRLPGGERLAAREAGDGPPGGQGRPLAAGDLLGEQRPEHLGRLPALGPGGGEHLGGGAAERGQPQPAQQGVQVAQRRRVGMRLWRHGRHRRRHCRARWSEPCPGRGAGLQALLLAGAPHLATRAPLGPLAWATHQRQPGRRSPNRARTAAVPERRVDGAAPWKLGQADRRRHLPPHPAGAGRGGCGQPQRGARSRAPGTPPRRPCGPVASGPAARWRWVGKWAASSRGLPGRGPLVARHLDRAARPDLDHDDLLAVRRGPRPPPRAAGRAPSTAHPRSRPSGPSGPTRAGLPEREPCTAAAGSGCSRVRSSASRSAGGRRVTRCGPRVDLCARTPRRPRSSSAKLG